MVGDTRNAPFVRTLQPKVLAESSGRDSGVGLLVIRGAPDEAAQRTSAAPLQRDRGIGPV